ncbi:MAG: metal-dependent transcriptional regulator [Magnetococcales bacterium]|nr:metal-dependent transcriptional regulator [Magnetococcales bacterium]
MSMETERRRDELLEMLWHLDEFHALSVTALREHDAKGECEEYLREFSSNGIIRVEGEQIFLTPQGKTRAAGVVRRHRLAERLLVDVLGKPAVEVEQDACEFEHLLAPGLVDAICTLLGHPQSCPHGVTIPPGPCCVESRSIIHSIVLPLTQLEKGSDATIAFLNTQDSRRLHKLMDMGLVPGVRIRLTQRYPAMVVQHNNNQIAFEESFGDVIRVWRTDDIS